MISSVYSYNLVRWIFKYTTTHKLSNITLRWRYSNQKSIRATLFFIPMFLLFHTFQFVEKKYLEKNINSVSPIIHFFKFSLNYFYLSWAVHRSPFLVAPYIYLFLSQFVDATFICFFSFFNFL
jgi:hypothetical protein